MPFVVPPPDFCLLRPEVAVFSRYQGVPYRDIATHAFGLTSRTMSILRFGQTTYRLRALAEGTFSPLVAGVGGEFLVDGFRRDIVGHGANPEEAYQEWLTQFHAAFQRLYVMRPFEMEEADRRLWAVIESQVDVEQYRASRPLIALQQGKVCRARPHPDKIEWEDGTKERIQLKRMPGEFATYKIGQPFEALVHRDPVSHKIIKVEYVRRLRTNSPTNEESQRLWDSVSTSASLPNTDWD